MNDTLKEAKKLFNMIDKIGDNFPIFKEIAIVNRAILSENLNMEEEEIHEVETSLDRIRKSATTQMEVVLVDGLEDFREKKKRLMIAKELFGLLPENEITMLFFSLVLERKSHEIMRFRNLENKEDIIETLTSIINKIIIQKIMEMKNLSEETIKEIEISLKESFPGLGNGQFRKIEKQPFQEEVKRELGEELTSYIVEKIVDNYEEFTDIMMLMINVFDRIDMLDEEKFEEIHQERFKKRAIHELYKANERKYGRTAKEEDKKEEMTTIINQKIRERPKKIFVIPEEISQLFDKQTTKEEILKYITRLGRNGKDIRIDDLVEKFKINPEIFTPKIIEEAKKHGLHIVENGTIKNGEKEKKKEEKKITIEDNSKKDPEDKLSPEEKRFKKLQEYIQKHKECFSAEHCIDILKMACYQIPQAKLFKKQFQKLYPSQANKNSFAEELEDIILTLREGINGKNNNRYRTIDLEGLNRILFFEKNIIDGIYNHNDYMRRLSNQK